MSTQSKVSKIGILIFRGFEPLDVFGPVEVFQMIALKEKLELFYIAPTLDPVSTAREDGTLGDVGSKVGTTVIPTHSYDAPPEGLEVLLVPGGIGPLLPTADAPVVFIKKIFPKLKYLITVCNGATLAARAGALDGRRATADKVLWKSITTERPQVNWVHKARYVDDGNVWTSSGVSAGIDCSLAWAAHIWGQEAAREAANIMEYEWKDDKHWDPFSYVFGEGQ